MHINEPTCRDYTPSETPFRTFTRSRLQQVTLPSRPPISITACRAISANVYDWLCRARNIPSKNRGQASFDPSHISNDHEEAGGADGDKGAGHSDPHRNPNHSEVHAGGLTLSINRFSSANRTGPYKRRTSVTSAQTSLQSGCRLSDA